MLSSEEERLVLFNEDQLSIYFFRAVSNGCGEMVMLLLAIYPDLIRALNQYGQLPIHVAVVQNQEALVKFLSERAPQTLLCRDQLGYMPVHLAACSAQKEGVLRQLISLDRDGLRMETIDGELPIHLAIMRKNFAAAEYMVEEDASLLQKKSREGLLPLHYALRQREKDIYPSIEKTLLPFLAFLMDKAPETLLESFVVHEIEAQKPVSYSPLRWAVQQGFHDLVWRMIQVNPDLAHHDINDYYEVLLSAMREWNVNEARMKLLIEYNPQVLVHKPETLLVSQALVGQHWIAFDCIFKQMEQKGLLTPVVMGSIFSFVFYHCSLNTLLNRLDRALSNDGGKLTSSQENRAPHRLLFDFVSSDNSSLASLTSQVFIVYPQLLLLGDVNPLRWKVPANKAQPFFESLLNLPVEDLLLAPGSLYRALGHIEKETFYHNVLSSLVRKLYSELFNGNSEKLSAAKLDLGLKSGIQLFEFIDYCAEMFKEMQAISQAATYLSACSSSLFKKPRAESEVQQTIKEVGEALGVALEHTRWCGGKTPSKTC